MSEQYNIEKVLESEYIQLLELWEDSIRATHHFLKEEDITFFRSEIPEYLDVIQLFSVRVECKIAGFIGVSDDEIEMLFIHPDYFGKGIGSFLLNYAINELHRSKVSVNEQNYKAYDFYTRFGFEIDSSSDVDKSGKPYPILHLILKNLLT